jgi:AcrR family transcriptional regulator
MTEVIAARMPLGDIGTLAAPTRLSVRLASTPVGASAAHPDARRAFLRARQLFIAGERIDMGELATELGVERTSLFRWVGNRDELLAEVLWSLAVPTLNHLDESVTVRGPARLATVLTGFVEALIAADYFRTFLRREPARALRLLTSNGSEMQRRFIAVVEVLVSTETEAGYLDLPLPQHDVASLLARMVESFSYSDLLTGEEPSADRARAAFHFVLRP